ncbi:MAG: ABC transporter ATP-binding protein [Flammeovirgaceae bacterium]|nr:MAG: ABC transporter ATP-binding protein [Flammeovirgaceae bacterium]
MIEVKKVSKRYLFSKSSALEGLSFKIDRFDNCALVGNNGCGKTTIIKILCNLIGYDSGDIFIKSNRLTTNFVSYKKDWGIVLSKPYFIEEFGVLEYLGFVAKFQKVENQIIKSRIDDLIQLLSLEDHQNKRIKDLSSGNQMKVTLASILIHNPEFLILDEPFVNLDISTTERFMAILKSFRGKKTTMITSHNLEIITELSDRIYIMDKGRIVSELENKSFGQSEELKKRIKDQLKQEDKIINADWLI